MRHFFCIITIISLNIACLTTASAGSQDPLPSWNDGEVKQAILQFVDAVTKVGGDHYVPAAERIATFDNDGTLWVEKPMYPQVNFAVDFVKKMAPQHPEWKEQEPFESLLTEGLNAVSGFDDHQIMELVVATHSGMTVTDFENEAGTWLRTAKHPRFDRPYSETIYQPQLELLEYLRANDFKTFIATAGGIGFVRSVSEEAYGIPPEQVVGSTIATEYTHINGKPELMRIAKVNLVDNKQNKPVGIYEHIGRRPILAFGNSDDDMQMVEFTKGGDGLRLGLFVHHTDATREYAYDRDGDIGVLNKALDVAAENDWIIVDMKRDWNVILPPEAK